MALAIARGVEKSILTTRVNTSQLEFEFALARQSGGKNLNQSGETKTFDDVVVMQLASIRSVYTPLMGALVSRSDAHTIATIHVPIHTDEQTNT